MNRPGTSLRNDGVRREGSRRRRFTLSFLVAWPAICAASAAATIALTRFEPLQSALPLIWLHFAGGLIAAILWVAIFRLMVVRRPSRTSRFIASFVALAILSAGSCAFLFAISFWHYFSQWHQPVWTRIGMLQTAFTFASAVYQYLALGMRHLVPLALPLGALLAYIASNPPRIDAPGPMR